MVASEDESKPSATFPLNQCGNVLLRESKHCLTTMLKDSLSTYRSQQFMVSSLRGLVSHNQELISEFTNTNIDNSDDGKDVKVTCKNTDVGVGRCSMNILEAVTGIDDGIGDKNTANDGVDGGEGTDVSDSNNSDISDNSASVFETSSKTSSDSSISSMKSILKDSDTEPSNTGIEKLQELIQNCIKMGGESEPDEEIITFVLNTVLTDNHYSNLNLMKPLKNDTMTSLTKFIKNVYVGRHVSVYLERFFDRMMGMLRFEEMDASLEDPEFYESFANIWKYDREEALYYDEKYYEDRFMRSYYSKSINYGENLEQVFFTNVKRFRYYMVRTNRINGSSYSFEDTNDWSSEEYEDVDSINRRDQSQFIPPRKSQIVIKFDADISIKTFDQEDPPIIFL